MRVKPSVLFVFAAILTALLTAGCGGGGESSPGDTGIVNTRVQATIQWSERSRALVAPSSARSARILLRGASASGGDFVWIINRDTAKEGYIRAYTSDDLAKTGVTTLEVEFHAELNGGGATTGFVKATIRLNPGGGGIPDLTTRGIVARVELGNQFVTPGQTVDLNAVAYDESNKAISLPPGSIFYFVETGTDAVRLNPADPTKLDALAPGTGVVRAFADGVASNVATVTVPISDSLERSDPIFPGRGFSDSYLSAGTFTGTGSVTMRSSNVNSYVYVYEIQPDGSRRLVAEDDDSAGGLNSLVIFPVKQGWAYVTVCTSTVPNQTGPYTLVLSRELATTVRINP